MNIIDSLSNMFDDDKSGVKALAQRRKERNENFKKKIKEQLFMTDDEAKMVIKLITKYDKKMDSIMDRFDVNNHQYIQTERMGAQLEALKVEMKEEVIKLINKIMRAKVNEAKQYFAEHPDKLNKSND